MLLCHLVTNFLDSHVTNYRVHRLLVNIINILLRRAKLIYLEPAAASVVTSGTLFVTLFIFHETKIRTNNEDFKYLWRFSLRGQTGCSKGWQSYC